jgi:hypothetical protein
LELIGVLGDSALVSGLGVGVLPGDWDLVSEPEVPVLGVWDSDLAVSGFGVWDSDAVWALAEKASIAPKAATLRKRQCLWKADRRIPLAPSLRTEF